MTYITCLNDFDLSTLAVALSVFFERLRFFSKHKWFHAIWPGCLPEQWLYGCSVIATAMLRIT